MIARTSLPLYTAVYARWEVGCFSGYLHSGM